MYFDTNWYRRTNSEVNQLEINPLTHYILQGELSGRRPVIYFDPVWYRQTYRLSYGENALAHYLAHRRSQKFSPNQAFDVVWYLAQNGSQVGSDRDPFVHYLQAGTLADIDPSASFSAAAYRRAHLGRISRSFPRLMQPDRHNPLVRYLLANYT